MKSENPSASHADLREPLQRETVASVGYRDLVSVELEATLADAVSLMQEEAIGCLVVVERGALRGIFTERDVVTRVLGEVESLDRPLREYMTADPVTARVYEPIHRVLARMARGGMRHLPVVDKSGAPIGTLSVKHAVHFLADHYPEAVFNIPPDPDRFPASREGA